MNPVILDRPPKFYARPADEWRAPLVCWLLGHRWVRTSFLADHWGNLTYECYRCDERVQW